MLTTTSKPREQRWVVLGWMALAVGGCLPALIALFLIVILTLADCGSGRQIPEPWICAEGVREPLTIVLLGGSVLLAVVGLVASAGCVTMAVRALQQGRLSRRERAATWVLATVLVVTTVVIATLSARLWPTLMLGLSGIVYVAVPVSVVVLAGAVSLAVALAVMSRQVVESAEGCGSDCGVVPVLIVEVHPAGQRVTPLGL